MGLLEPINTRITDPQYFLDTPQQGRNPILCHLLVLFDSHVLKSHGLSPWLPPYPLQRQPSCRRLGDPTFSCKW